MDQKSLKNIIFTLILFRTDELVRTLPIFSKDPLPPVPYNLTLFKGLKNVIISRKIAGDVLTHPIYLEFKNWLKDTFIPDETYFPTIAKIVNITQTDSKKYKITQNLQTFHTTHGICTRATMWNYEGAPKCYGGYVRDICQLTVQDLCSNIVTRPCLVANKFSMSLDASSILLVARFLSPMSKLAAHKNHSQTLTTWCQSFIAEMK